MKSSDEVAALRELVQRQAAQLAVMTEDIAQLRRAVVTFGEMDIEYLNGIDANNKAVRRARQIALALMVDQDNRLEAKHGNENK